jgi:hypothetical protein
MCSRTNSLLTRSHQPLLLIRMVKSTMDRDDDVDLGVGELLSKGFRLRS